MRVVTWNIHNRMQPWDYLVNELSPDIAFLQECPGVPDWVPEGQAIHQLISHPSNSRRFGNCIYVKAMKVAELPLKSQHTGSLLVGSIETPSGESIALINMYGLLERSPDVPTFRLVEAGTHSMLSDLTFLLEGQTKPRYNNFILCGDMNMDRRMDDHPTFAKKGRRTTNLFFDRIEDFLLKDCVRPFYPEGVQTFRHSTGKYPWQLDHMFARGKVRRLLRRLYVDDSEAVRDVSDHNPIVADFADL